MKPNQSSKPNLTIISAENPGTPPEFLHAKLPWGARDYSADPRLDDVAKALDLGLELRKKTIPAAVRSLAILATAQALHYRSRWESWLAWLNTPSGATARPSFCLYVTQRNNPAGEVAQLYRRIEAGEPGRARGEKNRAAIRARGRGKVDVQYDWGAAEHRGTALQQALGYGKTAFTDAVAARPRRRPYFRLNASDSAPNAPSVYSRAAALWFLARRLNRMNPTTARTCAIAIVKFQEEMANDIRPEIRATSLQKAVGELRRALVHVLPPG